MTKRQVIIKLAILGYLFIPEISLANQDTKVSDAAPNEQSKEIKPPTSKKTKFKKTATTPAANGTNKKAPASLQEAMKFTCFKCGMG